MNKTRSLLFASSTVVLLGISGCEVFDFLSNDDLIGPVWQLEAVETVDGTTPRFVPDEDERYSIRLQDNGSLSGRNDCNKCQGSYELSDGGIRLGMGCTEAGCGTPTSSFGRYPGAINSVTTSDIEHGWLRLHFVDRDSVRRVLVHRAD
jgi:hypothetical protein